MTWKQPVSGWTPERIALLTTLWTAGRSGSEVAVILGGTSRCAVVAKVHRLGLPGRERASSPASTKNIGRGGAAAVAKAKAAIPELHKERRIIHAPTAISAVRMRPMPPLPIAPPCDVTLAKVWTERRFGECAFPVSGEGADTLSCCQPSGPRGYCGVHRALMYTPGRSPHDTARNARRAA